MPSIHFIFLLFFATLSWASDDFDRQQIEERISPIGKVRLEEEKAEKTGAPKKVEQAAKEPGQEIYEQYCAACHQSGIAGAPIFRASDWQERIANKHREGLLQSALQGLNAMPPKGTCSECTEEELKTAIEYMLPKS